LARRPHFVAGHFHTIAQLNQIRTWLQSPRRPPKNQADDPDSMTLPEAEPATAAEPEGGVHDRRLRTGFLIGLCCLLIYNSNLRSISAGDTYPARYLPFAILRNHTILMNPVAKVAAQGRGDGAFWMLPRPQGLMSLYPIVVPVLVAPLYVPAVVYLHFRGWSDARLDYVARVMEKLSASFLAALSVSLLYLLLRRRTTERTALLLTLAYALGTTTWTISGQALWQHGLGQLLVIAALLLLTAPSSTPRALAVGLLCGLIACNRPPDVVLAAVLGAYALFFWAGLRRAVWLAMTAALPMVLALLYNLHFAGNIAGGYGVIGGSRFFQHDLLAGIGGLLISPTRGLIVFSPFVLFLVMAPWNLPSNREERRLTLVMSLGVVIQILLYAKTDWRSGLSWGPRYMTDLLPFLIWMLVPVVARLRGAGRVAFLVAVGVAVAIEAIGAFWYTYSVDVPIYAADRDVYTHDMRAAWHWRNAPFITSLKRGLAPPELAIEPRGNLDAIQTGGHDISVVTAGEETVATGWALTGHATPWQVSVIIDGHEGFSTSTFTDRPDVHAALNETSPSGWHIPIGTSRLAPGEHHLDVMVWGSAKGEGHYLDGRTLTVASPAAEQTGDADLDRAYRTAATRIREHQQAAGYWLTAFTSDPRFHEPRPEMNTFLTALMIDLLNPVAAGSGLEQNLQSARRHLTGQIESNGLVRYHGRPDGPGIGTLGCVITPDTDNTALVWRIAPAPDRARLAAALSTIDRYRTAEGLYRTWLAPREAYECLDPGRDPNPADIAIQMHLLLLLAEVRPQASRALCDALRPVVDDDRVWVYYRRTPLVPILRLDDLQRAGCDLKLPESRMRTEIPGQQTWIDVARWLGLPAKPDTVRMRAVLHELARNDFALIRTNPPLLYHNDLTATVSRYYWSEDVGYALWLRLYTNDRLHAK
jgi:hypothetical protein